jgi:hypothetical protein
MRALNSCGKRLYAMSGRKQFDVHLVERGEHGIIEKQDEAALTSE